MGPIFNSFPPQTLCPLSGSRMEQRPEHEVYAHNMLSRKGFAPWFPGPVNVAEVGYARDGEWARLFDATKEHDHESNDMGVPEGYYPLVVGKVRKRTIPRTPIMSEGGTELEFGVKASSSMYVSSGISGTSYSPLICVGGHSVQSHCKAGAKLASSSPNKKAPSSSQETTLIRRMPWRT